MPDTFSQLNVHCVFAVQGRENIITKDFRNELYKYISGILKSHKSYPLAINGWKDHVHVFFELPVTMSVADQIRLIKTNSSKWINENRFVKGKFRWQEGYGAFSFSRSQRDSVIHYVMNQEGHHRTKSFKEEYLELLDRFEVDYEERYLFEFYD